MDADVALLQEVGPGALERLVTAGGNVVVSPQDPWEPRPREHYGCWPMVVKLSDRVEVQWFRQVLPSTPTEGDDEIAVSNVGIIAAARVIPITGGEPFIAVSMYTRWFRPHPLAGSTHIYSDAAAHHIISDLSAFIGDSNPAGHWNPGSRGHEQHLRRHRGRQTGLVRTRPRGIRPHGRAGPGIHGTAAPLRPACGAYSRWIA